MIFKIVKLQKQFSSRAFIFFSNSDNNPASENLGKINKLKHISLIFHEKNIGKLQIKLQKILIGTRETSIQFTD